MATDPFQAELHRRQLAKSATRTHQQRIAALGMVLLNVDKRGKLEQIRTLHPELVKQLEQRHEANLAAKARAYEERARDIAEQRTTAAPIESDGPSTDDPPSYSREQLIDRQRAAMNAPPPSDYQSVQSLLGQRNFEVSPSLDKGSRRMTHGSELARRLRKLWNPPTAGDGGWMRNR